MEKPICEGFQVFDLTILQDKFEFLERIGTTPLPQIPGVGVLLKGDTSWGNRITNELWRELLFTEWPKKYFFRLPIDPTVARHLPCAPDSKQVVVEPEDLPLGSQVWIRNKSVLGVVALLDEIDPDYYCSKRYFIPRLIPQKAKEFQFACSPTASETSWKSFVKTVPA